MHWVAGLLMVAAGCTQATRMRCDPETAASNCQADETCVWTRSGGEAGYFCAITCSGGGACPSGQSCKAEAASSCPTCDDLLDLCE